MNFQLSLAFHIVGIVFWIAGLMVTAGLIRYFERAGESAKNDAYPVLTRKYFWTMAFPGLLITLTTGLYQIMVMGIGYYMKQGWFHGKMTLLLGLFLCTFFVWKGVANVGRSREVSVSQFGALHGIISTIFLVIVLMTYAGRV